jgi:TonB family protein
MTTLMEFWGQPLAHAMGWTLLHFCWQGAVIAVLLWCVLGLLAGRSPQLRYLAACSALALTVLVPLATFAYIVSAQHAMRAANATIAIDAGMVLRVGLDGPVAPWQIQIADTLDRAVPWVMLTWFAGVIFFLGRLNAGFLIARRMRFVATEAPPADLQEMFDELCARLEVSRPVRLLKSALVEVPTVIGWLRPVVLVPVSCFTGLSSAQIKAILSHELAHIRRHDYLVSVFQSVIEALLFYHPAVWWVSKQVRRERECCCDDMAVGVGGDALAYAKALSYLEERRSSLPEVALGANGGVLTMRIKRLLGCTERSAASQLAAMMVLMVVVAAIAASIGTMARAEARTGSHVVPAMLPVELEAPAALNAQIAAPRMTEQLAAPAAMALAVPPAPPSPSDDAPAVVGGAPAPSDALKVSAGTMQGALIYKPDPVYPEIAKAAHVQGAVVLHALISKTGTIESLHAISGPQMLQGSAMDAVRQWTYKPYLLNGQPVEVETTITVNYTFGEDSAETPGQAPSAEDIGVAPKLIGGAVSAPMVIYQVNPGYSEQARAAKFSGVVLVNLWVDQNGNPTHVHIVRGVGMGLDEKALEAVSQYKFKPAMEDGKPVMVQLNIEVNFRIFDPPKAQSQPIDRSHMSSVRKTSGDGVSL